MALGTLAGVNTDLTSLLLRLGLGATFAIHGYPKLKDTGKSAGQWLKSIGIPSFFGLFAGVVEFFGGIALLLGLLTPVVATLFVVWMVATIWLSVAKIKKKFMGGYELDVVLLVAALALTFAGAGAYSLDHFLWGS